MVKPLTLGGWNVYSLLDNRRSNRPEWTTVLVAGELAQSEVDISARSEAPFSDQGQTKEVGVGYTFYWSGRPRAERRDAGVHFAILDDIVKGLLCLPLGINSRLISLRLSLWGSQFATVISTYVPQMTGSDEAKTKFYEALHALLASVLRADKSIVLGCSNFRVGTDCIAWGSVRYISDRRLQRQWTPSLRTYAKRRLLLTNTIRLPMRKKAIWIHPQSQR
ncbi:hypothetical protein SprV_0100155900 [Sparganum proliferum]